jgi:hypothetical protein
MIRMIRRLAAVLVAILTGRVLRGLLRDWAASARAYEALAHPRRPTSPPPLTELEAWRRACPRAAARRAR